MVYKRRKYHYGDTHLKKKWRTKRRTKDLDQIDEDIKPQNAEQLLNQETDLDKPGSAQFYCIHCARYFINNTALEDHFRTKVHKRRLKALELEPYTIEDSERAAGHGSFNFPEKRKIETQPNKDDDVPSDKAQKNFAVLIPHIDFEERIQNKEELLNNIKVRRLDLNISNIEKIWYFYKNLLERKQILDQTRKEIAKEISQCNPNINSEPKQEEKLKMHAKIIKEDLKTLKEHLYSIEQDAAIKALSLPNILHKKTPITDCTILHQFLEKPTEKSQSHLMIAQKDNLVEFHDPLYYFFNHKCATFEMKILHYFQEYMLKNSFNQFSNSDFVRSIVVEGCGGDFTNPNEIFTLESSRDSFVSELSRLHLVGGSSLFAFMAYFTRHLIPISYFPLKYFTCGRKYQPSIHGEANLFTTSQETAIELFLATTDCLEQEDKEIGKITDLLKYLYDSLGLHHRLVAVPAHKLKNYECMRISVQMYSCALQEYVEVAHLSVCDNYLSKRLLCTYVEEKTRKFPRILSGTILSVQKLLGCVIEYNSLKNRDLLWLKNL